MSNKIIHNNEPLVVTYDNILNESECKHFIEISKNNFQKAQVSFCNKGGYSSARTCYNTWISHNYDSITKSVGDRISKIVGIPLENAEKFQIIHYNVNQEYKRHYDSWIHDNSEKTLRCMKYGGARLVTALCYLNDVEEGGETKMTKLDITINPDKGKLLIFNNTEKDTNIRHNLSEHAALPVIKGEKYAFNLWFRECNSSTLYSDFNPDYYKSKN